MPSRTRTYILLTALLVLVSSTVVPVLVEAQTYSISFVVVELPSGVGTRYYVDGTLNGTIQAGETKTLELAAGPVHTLSVDLIVGGGNGTRYYCTENFRSIRDTGTHSFTYKTQYHLEVTSLYGSPSGTDWYDEGATAYAKVAKNMTEGGEGVRYVFANWNGDASGQSVVSEPIVIDRPKRAVAVWKTQYTLRISSDPEEIFAPSTLWFDAGSTADFSAPEGTVLPNLRYVFTQWVGDYAGSGPQASVQMDSPKHITAKYKTQYLLNVTLSSPEIAQEQGMPKTDWYDAEQMVSLGPVSQLIDVSPTERRAFISWKVDNMTQQGISLDLLMDRSHQVEVIYWTQYYLEVVCRLPGSETTGSGWYFGGEKARFGVSYQGSDFPVKYSLASWVSNPSSPINTVSSTEAEITMDRPYVVEAIWNADYTPAGLFLSVLASAIALITAIVIIAVKRPGSIRRFFGSLGQGLTRRKVAPPVVPAVPPVALTVCPRCGAHVPSSVGYCQFCGGSLAARQPEESAGTEAMDERVYDYIVERHGEISLSRASRELGLSVDELKASTERLKKKGQLG